MSTTRVTRLLRAPRERVYAALVDPDALARWRFPAEMTCEVHAFEPREGGTVHVSLTYEAEGRAGKTEGRTDTYRGRLLRLVPGELVMEADTFVTDDPRFAGEMVITITLADADGGTELVAVHEGVPDGVAPEANEQGWHEALDRLAALVEC